MEFDECNGCKKIERAVENAYALAGQEINRLKAALAEKEKELFQEKTLRAADIKMAVDHALAELEENVRLILDSPIVSVTEMKAALRAAIGTKKEDPYSPENVLKNRPYTLQAPLNCPYCHAVDRGDDTCQQCGRDLRAAAEKEEQ